ncbi:hypothetical protein APHAL10511_002482 [Amanita phalloides]|nr:hypothetical protein APHAL10511_002482 [Amanita phalloides]
MDPHQPSWLKPGQSMTDFISTRRAPRRQIGRKSAFAISRMTPAPSKRAREEETHPGRFIDLRLLQAREHSQPRFQLRGGSSRNRFFHRKQALDSHELDRRMGAQPQKKLATQFATKSAPPTSRHVHSKSTFLFQSAARKTASTVLDRQSEDEDEDKHAQLSRSAIKGKAPSLRVSQTKTAAYKSIHRHPTSSSSEVEEEQDETEEENDTDEDDEEDQLEISDKEQLPMHISHIDIDENSTIPTVDPESLIQLFRAFYLHTDSPTLFQESKQLPFLLRNLRKSFDALCHQLGIPSTPLPEDGQGTVLVRYEHLANASFEWSFPKWFCPLCDLFGRFATKEMLKIHLGLAHKNTFFDWIQPSDSERQDNVSWRLHVLIPEIDNTIGDHVATSEPVPLSPPPFSPAPSIPRDPGIPDVDKIAIDDAPTVNGRQNDVHAPDKLPATTATAASRVKGPRPQQYPRPPPSSHRLGAAARPPYLPAQSTFGGPDVDYSTRIGGPYLIDLLQLLPLEPFGVFEWIVLDREEEIFADEDLDDEHKVITALWARWIMLNRNTFAADKVEGVKMFIDEYWRMIHLAAGWQALVHQIMVFAAYRLLKHDEVVPLILYYESLVGMDYWGEWDSEEE